MINKNAKAIDEAARNIRIIAFDVDGVLTDGSIIFTSSGDEIKTFHVRDGHAIKLAIRVGIRIALITGRKSPMVTRRAEELGIDLVIQGASDKANSLDKLLAETGGKPHEVAFLGDDIVGLPVIKRVGLGGCVADAVSEVKGEATVITEAAGGKGAAREFIVLILKAKGLWDGVVDKYMV